MNASTDVITYFEYVTIQIVAVLVSTDTVMLSYGYGAGRGPVEGINRFPGMYSNLGQLNYDSK